jgi:hypothetical protein
MANTIRHHYTEVTMIIPGRVMSAGTVFAMSGDRIMMDYYSCLGPIDPQIERNGKLIPALFYLVQFERLKERSKNGEIPTAEMVLLQQLDLAELHSFEEASRWCSLAGRPCVSASLPLCANVFARVSRRGAATRRGNRRASAVGPATNGEVPAQGMAGQSIGSRTGP